MTWGAVAIAGASLVGGYLGSKATKSAAQTQAQATQQASQVELQKQREQQAVLQPFVSAGNVGLDQLTSQLPQLTKPFTLQDFYQSPAYLFNLGEGTKAINKAAAARGMYYAPSTLQDIGKFTSGLASNEFENAFSNYQTNLGNIYSRLYGLSNLGESAAAGVGAGALQAGGQVGSNIMSGGAAQAAGTIGQANAISQALGGAGNALLMQQILSQNQNPTVDPSFGGVGASPY